VDFVGALGLSCGAPLGGCIADTIIEEYVPFILSSRNYTEFGTLVKR
jgi:hypothetical protein